MSLRMLNRRLGAGGFLAARLGDVSLEHNWSAQRVLIREGHFVTAFAIVRLRFEAVVRAVRILECAKGDWLERFTAPMADGLLKEPVLRLPVPAMHSSIAAKVPLVAECFHP